MHISFFSVHHLYIKLLIGGNLFSVNTIIFQCKQCVHSRVILETPERTWNIFTVSRLVIKIAQQIDTKGFHPSE